MRQVPGALGLAVEGFVHERGRDAQHPEGREQRLDAAGSPRVVAGPVEGRGRVRAKTGTLTGVASLAGVATDVSGRPMLFVLMADRVAPLDATDAEVALDAAAAALGACRCG